MRASRRVLVWLPWVSALAIVRAAAGEAALDRSVLPIPEPKRPVARNVKPPPRFEVKAPAAAPNVVIILIDDLGFGAAQTFGGPIATPTLERLAQGGNAADPDGRREHGLQLR